MDKENLPGLLHKVLNGTASDDEKNAVEQWFNKENQQVVFWDVESADEEAELEQEMLYGLHKRICASQPKTKFFNPGVVALIRAVLLIGAVLTGAWFLFFRDDKAAGQIENEKGVRVNRYIALPDSSVVILKPGNTITYDFKGKPAH